MSAPSPMTARLGLAVAGVLAACAPAIEMPTRQDGATLFARNCASCHGATATGGTAGSDGIDAPDLTGLALQNGGNLVQC